MDLRSVIIAPILEEFYYRRILQKSLLSKYKPYIAILISSLFFSIGHLSIGQLMPAFIAGIVLGYAYYKSQNILVPIGLHIIVNLYIVTSKDVFINLETTNYLPVLIYPAALFLLFFGIKYMRKTSF